MAVAVKMPQMGESVVEGTVARWLKAPGDPVAALEPLLEINTDKIDTEVPAPADGTLLEIVVDAGTTVRAGTVLAYIEAAGAGYAVRQAATGPAQAADVDGPAGDQAARTRDRGKPSGRAFVSPVVARIAAEHRVDLETVPGTGLGGRITKKDILAYLGGAVAVQGEVSEEEAGEETARPILAAPLPGGPDEWLQPLDAMRRAIAQHMVQSKQTVPHVTTVFEADMTAVVLHREAHKAAFAQKGLRLTFTPYFVAAAAHALRQVPALNARFHTASDGQGSQSGIVYHRRIHIGVAVALDQGLIVPVIRDADEKNLQGLARAVAEVAEQARRGKLAPDATRGGTFTITNHGVMGSLIGTPIIHQPQAGILGIGAIVKRPVVRSGGDSLLPSADDAIVIRPMCYLSLSFDHRVLDGAQADAFVALIKERLEQWPDD
jgi:2-oxoglutarate dehydrogenase E2 component (dihydrolipoamide succinyltransferase)